MQDITTRRFVTTIDWKHFHQWLKIHKGTASNVTQIKGKKHG